MWEVLLWELLMLGDTGQCQGQVPRPCCSPPPTKQSFLSWIKLVSRHLLTLNHFFLWSCSVLHPMLGVPSLGLAVAWPDGLRDRRGAAICLWTGQKTGFASAGTP